MSLRTDDLAHVQWVKLYTVKLLFDFFHSEADDSAMSRLFTLNTPDIFEYQQGPLFFHCFLELDFEFYHVENPSLPPDIKMFLPQYGRGPADMAI